MADAPSAVAIIGAGIAGLTCARELRAQGFDGRIDLIDPQGAPYDRPPLSKRYLAGLQSREELELVAPDWFTSAEVTLVTARAERIVPDESAVLLAGGSRVLADAVVLATGGVPRALRIPGGHLATSLRTSADADALRDVLVSRGRLAVVGAGLIGAEVASTAAAAGAQVTLLDPVAVPQSSVFGSDIARRLQAMHVAAGITTVTAAPVEVRTDGREFVVDVDRSGTDPIVADTVLVAIGIAPDERLAVDAGLDANDGVLVDAAQRTANRRVLAIGDSARVRRPDGTLLPRHEHWESAMREGRTAAATLVGAPPPDHGAPWFWSDRHGVHVEVVGSMAPAAETVVRSPEGQPCLAFALADDGRMLGAAAIDGGIGVRAARRIIDRGIVVGPALLADASVALKSLAR